MQQTENLLALFLKSAGVSTDSRAVKPNEIFFGLRGDNHHGSKYAAQVLALEPLAVVVEKGAFEYPESEKIIEVEDVLVTLQQLARAYRLTLETKVFAVGGSNGKTTTKELLFKVFSTTYKTVCTAGNLNNHIGVPLTLLRIPQDADWAIVEIGANHLLETKELCEIALPDMGVITNVGKDHLEGFGSIEGVAEANGELFDFLAQSEGIGLVNTLEVEVKTLGNKLVNKFTFPQEGDDYQCRLVGKEKGFLVIANEQGEKITTQLSGSFNFNNIATALAAAKLIRIDSSVALKAIGEYVPSNMRSQVVNKGSNVILLDAYNANPSSMTAAVESFIDWQPEGTEGFKRIVCLGDMLEMGEYAEAEHRLMGKLLAKVKGQLSAVYLVGNAMAWAKEELPSAELFIDSIALTEHLKEVAISNALILVKGSRGIKMERVVEAF